MARSNSKLFQPIIIGDIQVQHRVVLAPLTRCRADKDHVHGDVAVEYYGQRASTPGTLLITEGTFISEDAGGYDHVPGIYTEAQVVAWKKITDKVHASGSFIFCQLWALGRAAESTVLHEDGHVLVSASNIPIKGSKAPGLPKALTKYEIKDYVDKYTTAAKNAIRAGFDGVELHCANGYLPDQFLQTNSNNRTDEYGGSIMNRIRFVQEIMHSITSAIGESKTGIRLSPWSRFLDMRMPDPKPTFSALVKHLSAAHPHLAYISLVEPRISGDQDASDVQHLIASDSCDSNEFIRNIWAPRLLLLGGGFSNEPGKAEKAVENDGICIVFGRAFLANPDLPLRLKKGIPLNAYDRNSFFLSNLEPRGYVDYPFAKDVEEYQS